MSVNFESLVNGTMPAYIQDLTLGQLLQLRDLFTGTGANSSHPYKIGQNYLIRTVTMIQVGKLIAVHEQELVLEDAARSRSLSGSWLRSRSLSWSLSW